MIRSIVILSLLVGCGGVEVTTTEEPTTEVTTTEVTPGTTSATDVTVTTGTDPVTTTTTTPVTTGASVPATTEEPGAATPTTPATSTPTTVETSGSLGLQDLQSPVVASVDNCIQDYNVVECQSTDTDVVVAPAVETATVVAVSDTEAVDTDVVDSDTTATGDSPSSIEDTDAAASEESFFTPAELGFLSAGGVFLVGLVLLLRRRSA